MLAQRSGEDTHPALSLSLRMISNSSELNSELKPEHNNATTPNELAAALSETRAADNSPPGRRQLAAGPSETRAADRTTPTRPS